MALVNYSSSESEGNAVVESGKGQKRKRSGEEEHTERSSLPPLPSEFHDLYASSARVSTNDDPALHGGRKRIIPHVEGNWATHVYLEWHPSETEHKLLSEILNAYPSPDTQSLLLSPLSAPVPLHVSLSRPIVLTTPQRDRFLTTIEEAILASSARPFHVRPTDLKWFPNYEGTRWFLVLSIETTGNSDELETLVEISNTAAESIGQPPLYKDATNLKPNDERAGNFLLERKKRRGAKAPVINRRNAPITTKLDSQFHLSIGWSLREPKPELVAQLQSSKAQLLVEDAKTLEILFKDVKVKIGNTVTVVPLPIKAGQGKGLIGY